MNILTNKWLLSRRHLLRGIGASIALPMLDCMRLPSHGASELPKSTPPKRSVFLYIPNGVNTLSWQIEKAGADYELTTPLKSLERHRNEVTPISGLHHPLVIGKAHNCDQVWLTGANVPGNGGAFRNTVSADQLIAEVQGESTRFPSLEMAIDGFSLAWSRDGIQIPSERNVKTIFERMFGEQPGGKNAVRRRLNQRGSILDAVLGDAQSVNSNLGTEDRNKLDEYLTAVRQVELRTKKAETWLDVPRPKLDNSVSGRFTRQMNHDQVREYHRLFYDLMVLALRTDTTRVITCMIGSEANGGAIPDIGISQTRRSHDVVIRHRQRHLVIAKLKSKFTSAEKLLVDPASVIRVCRHAREPLGDGVDAVSIFFEKLVSRSGHNAFGIVDGVVPGNLEDEICAWLERLGKIETHHRLYDGMGDTAAFGIGQLGDFQFAVISFVG